MLKLQELYDIINAEGGHAETDFDKGGNEQVGRILTIIENFVGNEDVDDFNIIRTAHIERYDLPDVEAIKEQFINTLIAANVKYSTCGEISGILNDIINENERNDK